MTIINNKLPEHLKLKYWNHFIADAYENNDFPTGITGSRLKKIKADIFSDKDFWFDIILRHGGDKYYPEEMRIYDKFAYDHCMGNFWGMIVQVLIDKGLIK